jgi:hypothetical protein
VIVDEEATLKKSRRCQLKEVYEEEPEIPRIARSVREVPRVENQCSQRTSEGSRNFP